MEILIIIGIVGLMLTGLVFALNAKQKEMRDTKRVADMNSLRNALHVVKNETGGFDRAFCDLAIVSQCAKKSNSFLLKVLPELAGLNDPSELKISCADAAVCKAKECNYSFVKLESEDFELRFHLERGAGDLVGAGCYKLTPAGFGLIK